MAGPTNVPVHGHALIVSNFLGQKYCVAGMQRVCMFEVYVLET
jgi:hypothetical protein